MSLLPALTNTHAHKLSHEHHLHSQFELLPCGGRWRDSQECRAKKKHFVVYSTQICNFEPLGKDKALIGALCNVITPSLFVIKKNLAHLHYSIYCTVYIHCSWVKTEET